MEEKEIILKRKVVFQGNSEELYGAYPFRKLLTKKEFERYNEYCDISVYTDSYTDANSRDISIEDMKALIKKAEDAGANYIQIDYHCDHEEYDIYGSLITRPTKEEDEEIKRVKRVGEKMKISGRIRNLEAQIEELKKQNEKI